MCCKNSSGGGLSMVRKVPRRVRRTSLSSSAIASRVMRSKNMLYDNFGSMGVRCSMGVNGPSYGIYYRRRSAQRGTKRSTEDFEYSQGYMCLRQYRICLAACEQPHSKPGFPSHAFGQAMFSAGFGEKLNI